MTTTVQQLIDHLQRYPQDMPVALRRYSEYESLALNELEVKQLSGARPTAGCTTHDRTSRAFNTLFSRETDMTTNHDALREAALNSGFDADDEVTMRSLERFAALAASKPDENDALREAAEKVLTNWDHAYSAGATKVQKGSPTWDAYEELREALATRKQALEEAAQECGRIYENAPGESWSSYTEGFKDGAATAEQAIRSMK